MSFDNPEMLYQYAKENLQERIAQGEQNYRFRHLKSKQHKNRKGLVRVLSSLLNIS